MSKTTTKQYFPIVFTVLFLGTLGLLADFGSVWFARPQVAQAGSYSFGSLASPPQRLEALVQDTDMILIGTLGQMVQRRTFASYDANGDMKHADELGYPPDAEVPIYDYELDIERVLKSQAGVEANQPIILRMPIEGIAGTDYSTWDYPPSMPGERRLYFLSMQPDGKAYGLKYGGASRITLGGATALRTDGKQSAIPGAHSASPAEFVAYIERIIDQQATK